MLLACSCPVACADRVSWLLGGPWSPIGWKLGFVEADLTTVADTLLHWEQSLGHDLRVGRELPRSYRAVGAGPSCPSWACGGRNVMV
jgi:hypothetical protein